MRSKIITAGVVLGGLVLTGAGLNTWVEPLRLARGTGFTSTDSRALGQSHTTLQGVSFGVLGGFRALAADLVWLRAYVAWEKHDAPATESLLHLATALDGRSLSFWLNGARIMAYDMPAWRIADAGGYDVVSMAEQTKITEAQARRALSFLELAMNQHPTSAALWIERANIELNRLNNPALAAESYRRASEQPGAPYYPARLHAELLRRIGRKAEALAWLVALYPQLPKHVEAASATLVLARIRSLETELSVAPERRFSLLEATVVGQHQPLTPVDVAN